MTPYPFNVEWLPDGPQHYHGPRKRMRQMLRMHGEGGRAPYAQAQVVHHLLGAYPALVKSIRKVKFYCVQDAGMTLRFFLLWCDYSVAAREKFFEESEQILVQTGWYPVVTGNRVFHHARRLVDFVDHGLRKAMNRADIESLTGLGDLEAVTRLSDGEGTSILVTTSTYDIVLDTGMSESELRTDALRPGAGKWLFVSHSHYDHTGGMGYFVRDRRFAIAMTPLTLELLLHATSGHYDLAEYLPADFFRRVAPMWYRSEYHFADGSSVEVVPSYHCPGSAGFIFTFSDGRTLFYSGDLNVRARYVAPGRQQEIGQSLGLDLGRPYLDYAILDAAFVGRKIGSAEQEGGSILDAVERCLLSGRNCLLLTPPSDYGVLLFLHLYEGLVSGSRRVEARVFLDPIIITQLELLEWRLKRRRKGELDDALAKFLAARTTLVESVRVFDASVDLEDNLRELAARDIRAVAILDDSRFGDGDYISADALLGLKRPGLSLLRVGRAATKPAESQWEGEMQPVDFDEGIWLLHSQEQLLQQHLLGSVPRYGHVYLFHNFKGRLEPFIRRMRAAGYKGSISPLASPMAHDSAATLRRCQ